MERWTSGVARPIPRLLLAALFLPASFLLSACGGEDPGWTDEARAARAPVHVDSVFPLEEELRRFRAELEEPVELTDGAASREELVDRLIQGLKEAHVQRLGSLTLTQAEFAWFYYPNTIYTTTPYRLSPALVWYQQQNRSSRGLTRLVRRYGEETLYTTGHQCPDEGETFGDGWIWHGCTVLGRLPDGEVVEERLFGSILEWGGRYKLVSYSNEL